MAGMALMASMAAVRAAGQERSCPVSRRGLCMLVVACAAAGVALVLRSVPPTPSNVDDSTAVAVSSVRAVATTSPFGPGVPPLGAAARDAGFLDVRSVVPDAIVDLRYATPENFTGVQLYPAGARCLVHESLAPGLAAAAAALRPHKAVLVFWDCYRPHDVQVEMFEVVPNPAWVARPGRYARSHESGRSVDVTMAAAQDSCAPRRRVGGWCLADMGTGFDDFTPRATAFATEGVSEDARANRTRLRAAMSSGGLTVYSGEWWHFDGPGAGVERPVVDVPVT